MFSEVNYPETRCASNSQEGKINFQDEKTKNTTEKLSRMVLGKDEQLDDKYIKKFYLDIADEVIVNCLYKFRKYIILQVLYIYIYIYIYIYNY